MAKPDGKKSKGGKGNKGKAAEGAGAKNPAAHAVSPKPEKAPKVRGPKPDYTPKKKETAAAVVAQTDVTLIWDGQLSVVETHGMRFSVTKQTTKSDHSFPVVNLLSAPEGTPLASLDGTTTFVTVSALHLSKFMTKANPDSLSYKTQYQIWLFFDKLFREVDLKVEHKHQKVVEKKKQKPALKASASVDDFVSGKQGLYAFEAKGPRVVWNVKHIELTHMGDRKGQQVLVIEVASVDQGHPLFGSVRKATYIFHNQLPCKKTPDFRGQRAGECLAIWEYLTDLIASNRKEVALVVPAAVAAPEEKPVLAEIDLASGEYCLEPA